MKTVITRKQWAAATKEQRRAFLNSGCVIETTARTLKAAEKYQQQALVAFNLRYSGAK